MGKRARLTGGAEPQEAHPMKKLIITAAALGAALAIGPGTASAAGCRHVADGLPDSWEVRNHLTLCSVNVPRLDIDHDGLNILNEFRTHASPRLVDTNRNHVSDANEDADHDGVSNRNEQNEGTNPVDTDTDNDGVDDGNEDSDHDGVDNENEQDDGTNPADMDSDDDGIDDGNEDADHNGVADGAEDDQGSGDQGGND
jgi:hypothetical protein